MDDIQMRLPGSSSQSDLSLPKSNIDLQRWKELRGNLCQRCTQDLKSFNLTEHTSNQHIQKTNQPVNPPQQTRLRGRLRQLKHFVPCLINRFTCGCGSKKRPVWAERFGHILFPSCTIPSIISAWLECLAAKRILNWGSKRLSTHLQTVSFTVMKRLAMP